MDTPQPDPAPYVPPRAAPSQPAPQIVIHQERSMFGRFGRLLLIALVLAVIFIFGQAAMYESYRNPSVDLQEKLQSLNVHAKEKIAIISVAGTILEGDTFVKDQIDCVKEDDDVVGVVLRINSPGGTVTQSDYIYHHLRELMEDRELPIVVSMGSICASGGYYIAMAVGDQPDSIFAEPTTWTGSIGVVIPHYDLSGLLAQWNVTNDSITSGPLKQMGSLTRPMSDEERALLQDLVDISFAGFKEIVQNGRPKFKEDPAALDAIATGQIFTASQAVENGLVDKIGFIEAAIERAAELAGRDTDDLRCIEYHEQTSPLHTLLGVHAAPRKRSTVDLASMLDLHTPRAFYLYSWLPSILTNTRP